MKAKLIVATLVLACLSSCEVHDVTLVNLNKVVLRELQQQEMRLDVAAVLDNPNGFKINVTGTDLDLYLEERFIGKATLENDVTLAAKTEQAYDLEIRAIGEKLNQELAPIMLSALLTGKVTVRLKGEIEGKVLFFGKKVNVDIQEDVRFDQAQNQ